MKESVNYPEIAKENATIRDRANSSTHNYSRVVDSFNKALECKERFRVSLEDKLSSIGKEVNGNVENLETLFRNIDIYDQNIDKISSNLDGLFTEESSIKTKYEELLNGSSKESLSFDSSSDKNALDWSEDIIAFSSKLFRVAITGNLPTNSGIIPYFNKS